MLKHRVVLLVGSLWELVRFFLILLLFVSALGQRAATGPWIFPWLLVVGSGSLLIAVGAGMLGLFPDRYEPLLPFLRFGKILCLFSLVLFFVYDFVLSSAPIVMGGRFFDREGLLLVVFLLDAAFLLALFRVRPSEGQTTIPPEPPAGAFPDYEETEVHEYH